MQLTRVHKQWHVRSFRVVAAVGADAIDSKPDQAISAA